MKIDCSYYYYYYLFCVMGLHFLRSILCTVSLNMFRIGAIDIHTCAKDESTKSFSEGKKRINRCVCCSY